MPILRNIILKVLPAKARAAAIAESREWMIICPSCGSKKSVWDTGGLRWKARASDQRTLGRCSTCKGPKWMRIEKSK